MIAEDPSRWLAPVFQFHKADTFRRLFFLLIGLGIYTAVLAYIELDYMHLRDSHRDAAQLLARSVGLAPGASFETEARWLLALSLERLGKPDDGRRELAKLVATGIQDEYTRNAKQRLATDGKP